MLLLGPCELNDSNDAKCPFLIKSRLFSMRGEVLKGLISPIMVFCTRHRAMEREKGLMRDLDTWALCQKRMKLVLNSAFEVDRRGKPASSDTGPSDQEATSEPCLPRELIHWGASKWIVLILNCSRYLTPTREDGKKKRQRWGIFEPTMAKRKFEKPTRKKGIGWPKRSLAIDLVTFSDVVKQEKWLEMYARCYLGTAMVWRNGIAKFSTLVRRNVTVFVTTRSL
jgi:hypothetical protein